MKHPKIIPGLYWLGIALVATVATGCSGINAGKSFSPMDFILPGLMQNSPAPASPSETNPVSLLAQASQVQR
jgi:hypothetical protein